MTEKSYATTQARVASKVFERNFSTSFRFSFHRMARKKPI